MVDLGIVGGGQLGRMLTQKALDLGISVKVLSESPNDPAARIGAEHAQGKVSDAQALMQLEDCSVVTVELEALSTEGLRSLRDRGVEIHPSPETLEFIQDKGTQRAHLASGGIAGPKWCLADDLSAVRALLHEGWALPFVLKARRGGYDGRGVQLVRRLEDLDGIFEGPYLVESLVPIAKEIAVTLARTKEGRTAVYDPVEMIFDPATNLVTQVLAPARISDDQKVEAQQLALACAERIDMVGVMSVELFLCEQQEGSSSALLINEIAPRPHNSAHHTIEACSLSQFEAHLRAIFGQPLGDTHLKCPAAMMNLIGPMDLEGSARVEPDDAYWAEPDAHLHWYGKTTSRPGRKMGHITALAPTHVDAIESVARAHRGVGIVGA